MLVLQPRAAGSSIRPTGRVIGGGSRQASLPVKPTRQICGARQSIVRVQGWLQRANSGVRPSHTEPLKQNVAPGKHGSVGLAGGS